MWDYKLFGISFLGSFSPISRGATFNDDFLALSLLMRNHFLWVSIRNLVVNMRSRLLPYMLVKIHRKSSRNYAQQDKTPVHHVVVDDFTTTARWGKRSSFLQKTHT